MATRHFFSCLVVVGLATPLWASIVEDDLASLFDRLGSGGAAKDAIPALTDPVFVNPDEVTYVAEQDLVLGVFLNGEARAYPENLGWWHEVINDRIGDQFISVTLCPLTGTGLAFDTTAEDGNRLELGVSGLLINSNLVMFDRRDDTTLYPQMIFTAIAGTSAGQKLELLPVLETTWSMWQKLHPQTQVPAVGTGWGRFPDRIPYTTEQYLVYPYGDYRDNNRFLLFPPPGVTGRDDRYVAENGSLPIKDLVLGICRGDEVKVYPFRSMPDGAVINDEVGDLALLIVFDRDSRTAIPFGRVLNDRVLSFYAVDAEGPLPVEFKDVETGSRWNMRGEAVAGPLRGNQLQRVPAYNAMWFAWAAFWPRTEIWDDEGIIEEPATAVEEELLEFLPQEFVLGQNFPNPFNAMTQIQYSLPRGDRVRLSIYNAVGQKVRTLVDRAQDSGIYLMRWDGRNDAANAVGSGAYLYRLELQRAGLSEKKTMTLVR